MDQAPIKIGQYVLGKNLGIGAFGKVSESHVFVLPYAMPRRAQASVLLDTIIASTGHGAFFQLFGTDTCQGKYPQIKSKLIAPQIVLKCTG